MRVATLRTLLYEIRRRIVSSAQFATLHTIRDQMAGSQHPVRIERHCLLERGIRALEHLLPATTKIRIVVIPQSQRLPCRCIPWVLAYHVFQHRDRIFVGTGIVR